MIHKKWMVGVGLILFCRISIADTCPTVNDIKKGSLAGWRIYDSEDDTRLSHQRMIQFKKDIEHFALAEWHYNNNKEGTVHCYYQDANGSNLEAYLAKDHFLPIAANRYWYQVTSFMHCAAQVEKCEFQSDLLRKHLAKK